MSGKSKIFSRSGKSPGILKKMSGNFGHLTHVREFCDVIVREFYYDIIFILKLPSHDKDCVYVNVYLANINSWSTDYYC